MKPKFFTLLILLLASLVFLSGCRAPECQQMMSCCEAIRDVDGVGPACGGLAEGTRDPTTCRDVVRTISYLFEDSGEELPEACR